MGELKLSAYDGATKVVPTFSEKSLSGKKYLNYGDNNQFPNYLWELYLRSALLQSIINGTTDYVMGNGIVYAENPIIQRLSVEANKKGDTLDDIIKKITADYLIFGGFCCQLLYNKLNELTEIYWLDFRNVRLNKDGDKAFYSDDWVRHANDYIEYKVFDGENKKGSSVFYFKGHLSRGVYPIPKFNGALSAIETETEISKFHLNSILNNFSANFIISFNNGQPDLATQESIESQLRDKFCGASNSAKFLAVFNDSKDNAVTVERIQDDNFDKKYEALRTSTYKTIFIAFRATPQIFGYSLEGTGFSRQEFIEAFELYNRTAVVPIQDDLVRCFNKIFGVDDYDCFTFIPFQLEDSNEEAEQ